MSTSVSLNIQTLVFCFVLGLAIVSCGGNEEQGLKTMDTKRDPILEGQVHAPAFPKDLDWLNASKAQAPHSVSWEAEESGILALDHDASVIHADEAVLEARYNLDASKG